MEDPLRPRTGGRGGSAVGDVVFDNFQERITIVLLQIEAPADYKIVEHANAPFARNQTVDKVAANKPSPPVTTSQPIEALVFFDIFETKTPRDWVSDTVFATSVSVHCKPQGLPTTKQPIAREKMAALPTAEAELRLRAWKNSEIGEGLHFSVITAPRKGNVTTSVPAVTVCA